MIFNPNGVVAGGHNTFVIVGRAVFASFHLAHRVALIPDFIIAH